jgi:hypothetical protein
MKDQFRLRLVSMAMSVAALAAFVVPNWGKIW